MAYIPTFSNNKTLLDDNEKKLTQDAPTSLGGAEAFSSVTNKPTDNKTFTNYTDIVNANPNSAQNLGNKVTNFLGNEQNKATDKINQTKTGLLEKINANVNKPIQGSFETIANDPTKLKSAQNILNASYTGPQDTSDLENIGGEIKNVTDLGNLTKNESGRVTLLQKIQDPNRRQSTGRNAFDQLLINNNDTVRNQVNEQTNKLNELNTLQSKAKSDVTNEINKVQNQNKLLADDAKNQILNEKSNLETQLSQNVNNKNTQLRNNEQSIKDRFSSNQATDSDLANLGITREQYGKIKDKSNVNKYFVQNPVTAGIQNVVTPEQKAKYDALVKILGAENTLIPQNFETLNEDTLDFDFNQFDKDEKLKEIKPVASTPRQEEKKDSNIVEDILFAPAKIISEVFCHEENTMILMANKKYKKIKSIKIGDETFFGKVLATGKALATYVVNVNGEYFTESHTMFVDNIAIKASELSDSSMTGTFIVCPIVVENNIVVSKHNISSDFKEFDQSEHYTQNERLAILNTDEHKENRWKLLEQLNLKK